MANNAIYVQQVIRLCSNAQLLYIVCYASCASNAQQVHRVASLTQINKAMQQIWCASMLSNEVKHSKQFVQQVWRTACMAHNKLDAQQINWAGSRMNSKYGMQ